MLWARQLRYWRIPGPKIGVFSIRGFDSLFKHTICHRACHAGVMLACPAAQPPVSSQFTSTGYQVLDAWLFKEDVNRVAVMIMMMVY